MNADLKHHIQKLFEYSKCKLFFHLTCTYYSPIRAVVAELEVMAEQDAADHCKFIDRKKIRQGTQSLAVSGLDTRPTGKRLSWCSLFWTCNRTT